MLPRSANRDDAMTLAFEDFHAGQTFTFGASPVTAESIVEFARQFDPQPFHLDAEAAKRSLLGGLSASGWHTCAMMMRMLYDGFLCNTTGSGAPGIDEVRWLKPVRPGMTLGMRVTMASLRVSKTRPDLGFVSMDGVVHDAAGDAVMTSRHTNMFARRNPAAPIPAPQGAALERKAAAPEPVELRDGPAALTRFSAYYEDALIGATLPLGSHPFTREETTGFARLYDPQPFHLDDAAAAATHFGRLSASGWHTAAVCMRLTVETRDRIRAQNAAPGDAAAPQGPSPGFRDLSWLRPVFAGDTITYDSTIVAKRPASRPGWGIVNARARGFNQDGAKVFEYTGAALTPMRATV